MQLIPSSEEQIWLIERLTEIIVVCGKERFLDGEILDFTVDFASRPWHGELDEIWRLTRQLLHFAGIDDLNLEIELVAPHLAPEANRHIWSTTGEGGENILLLNLGLLGNYRLLVQCLAWFTAVKFAERLDRNPDSGTETYALAELAATYLGFGVLRLDSEFNSSKGEVMNLPGMRSAALHQELNIGLPLSARAFLLAAQGVARDWNDEMFAAVKHRFATDQSTCFQEAWLELIPWREELKGRLKLNQPGTACRLKLFADINHQHLDDEPRIRIIEDVLESDGDEWRDPERVVQRVEVVRRGSDRLWLVFPGIALAALGYFMFDLAIPGCLFIVLISLQLGVMLSPKHYSSQCSDPACNAKLQADETICPGCGGNIVTAEIDART
ncbi:MAG: hypothetical protein GY835_10625 [bacterium]|nr:hypothetical protein [bacterium]